MIPSTQYGTRYAVQLSNFPPGSQVSLRLVRKQVRARVCERTDRKPLLSWACLSVDLDAPHTFIHQP